MKSCSLKQNGPFIDLRSFQNLLLLLAFAPALQLSAQVVNLDYGPSDDGAYKWSLPNATAEVFRDAAIYGTEIIAAGYTDIDLDEGGNYRAVVVKLNHDGIPVWGPVYIDFPNSSDEIYGVAVQSDGKIVLAGSTDDANGILRPALFRLNTNGTLDNTFGTSGRVIFTASVGRFRDVAVLPNGKIVACGLGFDVNSDFATLVARYNSNGQLDVGFNSGLGYNIFKVGIGSGDEDEGAGLGLAVQSDGKVVVCGYTENGTEDISYVARLTVGGALDPTFDTDGKKHFYVSTSNRQYAHTVGIDGSGRIVVGGHIVVSGEEELFLARFLTPGNADNSFANYGYRVYTGISSSSYEYGFSLAFQADGKILLAGSVNFDVGLIRVKNDGLIDPTHGINGFFYTSLLGEYSEVNKVLMDGSRIYLVGAFTPPGGSILDDDGFVMVLNKVGIVGTDEAVLEVAARLFPNPADEAAYLETGELQNTDLTFEMFDMLGRQVASGDVDGLEGRTRIPTAGLPVGTYRLVIYQAGAVVKGLSLVVAR